MGIGLQRAGQRACSAIQPLARDCEQFTGGGQRSRRGPQLVAAAFLSALPANHHPPCEGRNFDEQLGTHRDRHLGGGGRCRRALVGGEVDQRDVGLVADRRDQRDHALGGGADHGLLVERPQVLQRTAAARDDQHIRPRNLATLGQRVEAANCRRDLFGRAFALHPHRPYQHVARKAVFQPVQDVANHRTGRRGDDTDHFRQPGQKLLARLVEQPLGGELALALFHQRHQRADAGGLDRLDHDLVFRRAGVGGEFAGGDDLQAFLRLEAHPAMDALPDHRLDLGALVLQREIAMPGGVGPAKTRDFAAHPDMAIGILHRPFQGGGQFGHREFRCVDKGFGCGHVGYGIGLFGPWCKGRCSRRHRSSTSTSENLFTLYCRVLYIVSIGSPRRD